MYTTKKNFHTTKVKYTDFQKLFTIPEACTEIPRLQVSQGNVVGDHEVPARRVVDCPAPCQIDDVPDYQKMEVNRPSNDYGLLRLLAFSVKKENTINYFLSHHSFSFFLSCTCRRIAILHFQIQISRETMAYTQELELSCLEF